jgi:hypothetical protein
VVPAGEPPFFGEALAQQLADLRGDLEEQVSPESLSRLTDWLRSENAILV